MEISKAKTVELLEELKKRKAVQAIWVEPYKPFEIINDGKIEKTEITEGACWVVVVWD